jgi:hypothetical protein
MFFQQFVGINALIYYSLTLFATMGLDYEMQLTMSGVLNVCQVVAYIWSLWGMDHFGRRKLLLGGGVCMVSPRERRMKGASLTITQVPRPLHHCNPSWTLPR